MSENINPSENSTQKSLNFIEQIVVEDLAKGKNDGRLQTRFPPEPNGYLHIGHAKAICMDFGVAEKYNGVCNLRFDDTNPSKEDTEYVDSILNDIQWLGFKWGNIYYASDYFQKLWDFAVWMIENGKAYIDEQTSEQIAEQKGTPTQAGVESPYRNRPVEESLELVLSLFPEIAYRASSLLGFQAPINFVYLVIIAVLIVNQFAMTIRISQMDSKVRKLAQRVALNEEKIEREKDL